MSMLGECSKGPWTVRSRIGGNEIRDADDLFVAPIDGTPATERLVAAAPELYNALFDLLHILDRDGAEGALIRAIRREIAKVDPQMRPWPMRKETRS